MSTDSSSSDGYGIGDCVGTSSANAWSWSELILANRRRANDVKNPLVSRYSSRLVRILFAAS